MDNNGINQNKSHWGVQQVHAAKALCWNFGSFTQIQ